MIGRYECTSDNHSKYYILEKQSNGLYRTTWGKIGLPPLDERTDLTESHARNLIKQKLKNGYQLVSAPAPISSPSENFLSQSEPPAFSASFPPDLVSPKTSRQTFCFLAELKQIAIEIRESQCVNGTPLSELNFQD